MKQLIKSSLGLVLLLPVMAHAAVMIETRDPQSGLSQIYIQGDKARIDMPRSKNGYVVMDVKNKTMKVVMNKQRMVMDMSEFMTETGADTQGQPYVDSYTKSKGLGPTIAGYETEEYEIYGDGKYCGSVDVSVRAIRDLGLKKFARALMTMEQEMNKKMSGLTGGMMNQHMGKCAQAHIKTANKLQDIGFPLRSLNQHHQVESTVTRINKHATLPAGAFTIPASYKVTNMSQMMNGVQQQLKQMQPQMNQMMQNMSPEMQERMRQQMQQFQPQ